MRLRSSLLLSCFLALNSLAAAGQVAAGSRPDFNYTIMGRHGVAPIGTALIVAAVYLALFKLFSRWPRYERWLVGALLIALPPLSTYVFQWNVYMLDSVRPVLDTGIFWLLISVSLAVGWWFLKYRSRLLESPTAPAGTYQPRSRATARESANVAPSEPPTAVAPAPAPSTSSRPPAQGAAPHSPDVKPAAKPAAATRDAIFISYRRMDSADVTGRIYDRLVQRFGREQVFKDVDSIPLGVDFRVHLGNVVGRCSFLLAVIGPQWLSASGENGRRLEDKSDFVRVEIESALARDIPVIPVLVGGASLPSDSELPPSLGAITFRNGIRVRPDPDFHRDMDRLIAGLEQHGHG